MIPVYAPEIGEEELANAVDCIKRGALSGTLAGDYVGRFEQQVSKLCGVKHGITTSSGTTALALAVASLGLGPGDEVIVPAFTNIATALAVVYSGARPVFVDSERETWNVDVAQVRRLVTPRTRAIMPVHIFGHPVDMDSIMEVANEFDLYVIEDGAEALGARYKERLVGGIGDIGCFSFFINKIVTTGEGGMVVTDDDQIAERARLLKNLAYSRRDKFIHEELGYNYRMTNLQASLGVAQMPRLGEIVEKKRKIASSYTERLKKVSGLQLPCEMSWAKSVYWVYGVVLQQGMPSRDVVRDRMTAKGIETRSFFYPLHRQPVFKKMGISGTEELHVADWLWEYGLYLPSGPKLTEQDVDFVSKTLMESVKPAG